MSVKLNARLVRIMLAGRDMSVRDLAKIADLHEQTLYKIMAGSSFSTETLGKVARALECHPVDLIEAEGYPAPHVDAPTMATV